jgi:DNA-binding NarL/FixJ family response regulator
MTMSSLGESSLDEPMNAEHNLGCGPGPGTSGSTADRDIRLIIVDDHQIVRAGLQQLLETEPDLSVVASAGDGSRALALIAEHRPDLVLMDLSMPVMDGVEATWRVKAEFPDTRILVLSSYGDEDHVVRALEAGADGYLLKHSDPEQLLRAIRDVLAGGAPLSAQVSRVLLESRRRRPSAGSSSGAELTDRETDVLHLVMQGLANKQIAIRLGIAERTVKAHLSNIFQRLDVTDRTSAAMWARENLR